MTNFCETRFKRPLATDGRRRSQLRRRWLLLLSPLLLCYFFDPDFSGVKASAVTAAFTHHGGAVPLLPRTRSSGRIHSPTSNAPPHHHHRRRRRCCRAATNDHSFGSNDHSSDNHLSSSLSSSSAFSQQQGLNNNNNDNDTSIIIVPPPPSTTMWSKRGELFRMTRPLSLPGVVLFHMIGVYLVLQQQTSSLSFATYWNVLTRSPPLWCTLLSLILVSCTSMICNDYYDAKLGRDNLKTKRKPLVSGKVPFSLAKQFVTFLYSISLMVVCVLPGTPTRIMVTTSLQLTYLYTKHLKPLLGVKNIVCAVLVAMAPWTSGMATKSLLLRKTAATAAIQQGTTTFATMTTAASSRHLPPSLWRLVMALFFGVLGREIMLDCNDVEGDKATGITTLPVVYGQQRASSVAFGTTVVMSAIVLWTPLWELCLLCSKAAASNTPLASAAPAGSITTIATTVWSIQNVVRKTLPPRLTRRLALALAASVIMLRRSWQVFQTKGKDARVNKTAVDESLLTVVLLLTSFV